MYPNPLVLFRNLARYRHLPLDPAIEQEMGWDLPSEPLAIEYFVDSIILSSPDWPVWRVPWYVPDAREAATVVHGDCEAKTILLASIFEGKGIPYDIRASFNHIWVDYAERPARAGESSSLAYLEGKPGRFRFHWPDRVTWATFFEVQRAQLWEAMPLARKAIWFLGLVWVLFAALLLGSSALTGDLQSRWRLRPSVFLARSLWLALAVFVAITLAPNLRPESRPVRWTIVDLREVLALCLLSGPFFAWLTGRRARRAALIAGDALVARWSLGFFQGSRQLAAGSIDHFELAISGGPGPWLLSAALRHGERVPLLAHGAELPARAALRRLGLAFSRPLLVRSSGSDYWTAADEIGLNVAQQSAQRPRQTPPSLPDDCHLSLEEADGRWALGYPLREKGATRVLLAMAAAVFVSGALATLFVALAPRSPIAWVVWVSSAALVGLTAYAAICLRDEVLAWLGGSHVEVGEGRLTFFRADGGAESVPVDHVESVELARLVDTHAIAVVSPERILHLRLYCAPRHREWVRAAVESAVARAA
jgi:hypothetical protein